MMKINAKEARLNVSRQFTKNGRVTSEDDVFETIDVLTFSTQPASVSAKCGLTIKLRDYEMARVDAMVTLPCYVEEIPYAFKMAWEVAENEIEKQKRSIKGE